MNALRKLWGALSTLADNLTALAGTVNDANTALRERLALPEPPEPLLPDHIDHTRNGYLPPPPVEKPEPPKQPRNGRRKGELEQAPQA